MPRFPTLLLTPLLPPSCRSKPITDFIEEKVDYQDDGGVAVDDKMMTSVDGIYAIGDIRNTPFKQARSSSLPRQSLSRSMPPAHHRLASRPSRPLPRPRPRPPLPRPNRNACDVRSSGGGRRRRRLHSRDGH